MSRSYKPTFLALVAFLYYGLSFSQDCHQVGTSFLDGSNGFLVSDPSNYDMLGRETHNLGDVNGDGVDDILIGAPLAEVGPLNDAGAAYILFGETGFSAASFDPSTLDGSNGFSFFGDSDRVEAGFSVSGAGDVNGDGLNDILVGIPELRGTGGSFYGAVALIYGSSDPFPAVMGISDLDGFNGMVFRGLEYTSFWDGFGTLVRSAGDINNDGYDDLLFGAESFPGSSSRQGRGYLVFGSATLPPLFLMDSLDGSNGFHFDGFLASDGVQLRLEPAGDVNNDGFDDFMVGMRNYDTGTQNDTGRVFVIFGRALPFPLDFDLGGLDGSNGFVVTTNLAGSQLGYGVGSAGDFNGDGIDDIAFSLGNRPQNSGPDLSEVYVMYGRTSAFAASQDISALDPTEFSVVRGESNDSWFGQDLGSADFDNDGLDDLIISEPRGGLAGSGGIHVIFGRPNPLDLGLEDLDGSNGFGISRDLRGDEFTGHSAGSAGDFNNDGYVDLLIGTVIGSTRAGRAYVVYVNTLDLTDNTPPVVSCPAGESLYAGSVIPSYLSAISASDNCTYRNDLTIIQDPAPGTPFNGSALVNFTVVDEAGNSASCSFTVTTSPANPPMDCSTGFLSVQSLDGFNGTTVHGERAGGLMGFSVRNAGDFNGDGIMDIILGGGGTNSAFGGQYGHEALDIPGKAYVVFGINGGLGPNVLAGTLDGNNGVNIVDGSSTSRPNDIGYSVSRAGDINGDGIDDVMVSNPFVGLNGDRERGATYVLFGRNGALPPTLDVLNINGANGFMFYGFADFDQSGRHVVHIGDINGDGLDDIAINAPTSSSNRDGKVYVVFGSRDPFPAMIDESFLDGNRGIVLLGDFGSRLGIDVTGLGDVNGDGIDDLGLVAGSNQTAYVLYGNNSLPASINAQGIAGGMGFEITLQSGRYSIDMAGDINGDGINDILLQNQWLLFGRTAAYNSPVDLTLLNGSDGFGMQQSYDLGGFAGDFNNDGFDDLALEDNGSVNLLFGNGGPWAATVDIAALGATEKAVVRGPRFTDIAFAGDVNDDGFDDILLGWGRSGSNPDFNANPGMGYLIHGFDVVDGLAPTVACPSDQELAVGSPLPDYLGLATVSDDCDPNPSLVQTPPPGSNFTPGMSVRITATDKSGNVSDCSFFVNSSSDTTPPTIVCPGDQTVDCGARVLPDFSSMVGLTDDQDANPILSQSPAPGEPVVNGMTVTMTGTDASGNSSSCSFVVNRPVDNEAPIMDCAVSLPGLVNGNLPDYTIYFTATDNCDANPLITQTPAPGTPFDPVQDLVIRATDAQGNWSSCTYGDNAPPVLGCPPDQTVDCGTTVIQDYRALVSVVDLDPNPSLVQSPPAGSPFSEGMTITMTATDAKGQSSSCSFILNTAPDATAPLVTCPPDQELAPGSVLPDYIALATVSDNCDGNPVLVQDPAPGTIFDTDLTISIRASDASGNTRLCSFVVRQAADTVAPTIVCPGNLPISCSQATLEDYRDLVTVMDDSGAVETLLQTPEPGTTVFPGMEITITAIDAAGNMADCSFELVPSDVVVDAGADVLTTRGNPVELEGSGPERGQYRWTPALGLSSPNTIRTSANPEVTTTYVLNYISENGLCTAMDEITVIVEEPVEKVQQGFSPNQDGINDTWVIRDIESYPDNSVFIYNRWGNLVFNIDGYDNNGKVFAGEANRLNDLGAGSLPEGTYFYRIVINGPHNLQNTEGFIVLKR